MLFASSPASCWFVQIQIPFTHSKQLQPLLIKNDLWLVYIPPASEPSDHTLEPWSLCAVLGSRDVTHAAWRSHHPSVLRLVIFFLQNRLTCPSKVCPQGRQRVNVYHPWMVSDNAKTHLALNDFECIAMVYVQRGMDQDIYIYIWYIYMYKLQGIHQLLSILPFCSVAPCSTCLS